METIKLTMLGGSRTGKTCYLVGMYGMMRRGEKGFTFAAADLDEDLKLAQDWKTLRTTTGEQRWPPPTAETMDREFDFCYGYKPFRRFVWHDYRGGALHSPTSDPDAQRLIGRLADSSCILLCFSSAHLTGEADEVAGRGADAIQVSEEGEDEATRMNRLLSEVAKASADRGQPLPAVVIVLTKYDLIARWPREAVNTKIKVLFRPLFAVGGGWTVTLCPVSLGKGLAESETQGKVEGINLHRPVAFAVYCAIRQDYLHAQQAEAAYTDEYQKEVKKPWWQKVRDYVRGRGGRKEALADASQRSHEEQVEFNRQLEILFTDMIKGLVIYHNGQECEFND